MRIDSLMLAEDDWANTGYRFQKCLESIGVRAYMFKGRPHAFMYPHQAVIHPALNGTENNLIPIVDMAERAEVIHFLASTYMETGVDLQKKNVVVQHGGTSYRQHADEINKHFNEFADYSIIQCPDLLGLGAKNEVWIPYPVDTEALQPGLGKHEKSLRIGHFPSNPKVKGTETVRAAFDNVSHHYRFVKCKVEEPVMAWQDHLDRMASCDVIVEGCEPLQNGKPYGTWGNTALEAAALGKIVITHSMYEDKYAEEFGGHPLLIANTQKELEAHIVALLQMGPDEIKSLQMRHRGWAVDKHSMRATANRLWKKVYKHLLAEDK